MARVVLDNVGHRYPGSGWLFRSVAWTIGAGESVAITGPSGSGKSTLLAIVAGLIRPEEGSIVLDDVPANGFAWSFQRASGISRRSTLDQVAHPFLARGVSRSEAEQGALDLLARVGLADRARAPFGRLSGGEAQRVSLARAAACARQVMLVDEPTAALDRATAAAVADGLRSLSGGSAIMLVATHDPLVVDACDSELSLAAVKR